jgi:hypothetical protein
VETTFPEKLGRSQEPRVGGNRTFIRYYTVFHVLRSCTSLSDGERGEFKTLLQEERERKGRPLTLHDVDKIWWKRERTYHFSCPHVENYVCALSKRFRKAGSFICSGSWHDTCEVYLLVKNNDGDPTVLISE